MYQLTVNDDFNEKSETYDFRKPITPVQAFVFLHCHTNFVGSIDMEGLIKDTLEVDDKGLFNLVGEDFSIRFTDKPVYNDELILEGDELNEILSDIIDTI